MFLRGLLVEGGIAPSLGLSAVAGVARLDRVGHANDTTVLLMYSRKYTNGVEANGLAKMFRGLGPNRQGPLDTEGPSR